MAPETKSGLRIACVRNKTDRSLHQGWSRRLRSVGDGSRLRLDSGIRTCQDQVILMQPELAKFGILSLDNELIVTRWA